MQARDLQRSLRLSQEVYVVLAMLQHLDSISDGFTNPLSSEDGGVSPRACVGCSDRSEAAPAARIQSLRIRKLPFFCRGLLLIFLNDLINIFPCSLLVSNRVSICKYKPHKQNHFGALEKKFFFKIYVLI